MIPISKNIILVILFGTLSCWTWPHVLADGKVVTDVLDGLLRGYDKRVRPNAGLAPVEVGVTCYVLAMPQVDPIAMTMTIDLYFRQTWKDPRLNFTGDKNITLDGLHLDKLWVPDTFMVNEMSSKLHDMTIPNMVALLYSNGQVLKSGRYTIELSCPMDFSYFPFESNVCTMDIESYGYKSSDIYYKWSKGNKSFGMSADASLPQYSVMAHQVSEHFVALSSGNYSRLAASIWIQRAGGRYVVEFFVPSIILTSISLVALLVAETRTSVIINVITLCVTIIFTGLSTGLMEIPRITYSTSMDTFSGLTYSFICISLLISTLDFYLSKRNKRAESIEMRSMDRNRSMTERLVEHEEVNMSSRPPARTLVTPPTRLQAIRKNVCDILLKLLPAIKFLLIVSYILANLIYWSVQSAAHFRNQNMDELISQDWNIL